jgi:hypothetical protein
MAEDVFEKDKELITREANRIKDNDKRSVIPNDYGLCNKCTNFSYLERELDTITTCDNRRDTFKIDSRNPVRRCSDFVPAGVLGISAMWSIAKLIDFEDEKEIGFGIGDKSKVKVREPQGKLNRYRFEEDD